MSSINISVHCIAVTVLIFCNQANAQTTVRLEEYDTHNLVFTGYIGERTAMPVTFCLNVANMSSGYRDWYSVSGWFQHRGANEPLLPLAGVKSTNLLTLYYFKQGPLADTLLNFRYDDDEKHTFRELMERYHDMGGFMEKMTFENVYGKFEKKQLSITVYQNDLDVLQHKSLLTIRHNGHDFTVDLYALNIPLFYPGEHVIEGYKAVDGKIRIVLSYDRASKAYALGACGAGNEVGFLSLEFDERGKLLLLHDYLISSCLKNINCKPGYKDDREENYIVTDAQGLVRSLSFNSETMTLEWNME